MSMAASYIQATVKCDPIIVCETVETLTCNLEAKDKLFL